MKISGFTIVRNAQILDYPFPQNILSILPLCDEFVINCGDSQDQTLQVCKDFKKEYPKIKVVESVWPTEKQTGGGQLKIQTDLALHECRGSWCFYIQADEVVHEADWPKIISHLERADELSDVDGILFDYLHFYGSSHYTMKGRNWYRREVRLFKNHRHIAGFRDAQGFRKQGEKLNVIRSGARIFHYGYVRSIPSYLAKSREMSQWWGQAPITDSHGVTPRREIGLTQFYGTHPRVMSERLASEIPFDPKVLKRRWNWDQIKNLVTLVWEAVFRIRIGEFKNYVLLD